ncbi:MAG: M1 family aminopeptidase [bacterium]
MKRKASRNLFIMLVLVIFSSQVNPGFAQDPSIRNLPSSGDLPHYDIHVQLNNQSYTLTGKVKVTCPNTSDIPLEEVLFQLAPNTLAKKDPRVEESTYDYSYPHGFNPSWMEILGVNDGKGNPLPYSYKTDLDLPLGCAQEKTLLLVTLPKPLAPGENDTLEIDFKTRIPEKYADGHYQNTLYLQGFWYPTLLSRREGEWITGLEESPPAFFHLSLTVPSVEVPVSSAAWERSEDHPDGTTTYSGDCGPTPLLALASSRDYLIAEKESEGVTIKVYYFSRDVRTAQSCLQYAAEAIRFIHRDMHLPLTFDHLSIVDFHMGATAAYTSGNAIFIPRELHKFPGLLKRIMEVVVAHEVSHLWWGVGLTYNFDKNNWVGEGLANYTSIRYFEKKYGAGKNLLTWPKWMPNMDYAEYFVELPYREEAVRGYDRLITESAKASDDLPALSAMHYDKGAMIHRMLNYLLKDENYTAFLQALIQRYYGRIVTTQEMISLCQEVTGQDLTWFFDQWIYDTKKLDYSIDHVASQKEDQTATATAATTITTIRIRRLQEAVMPVELLVVFQDGSKKTVQVSGRQEEETITLRADTAVAEAHLDPGHILPDINRLNNHYRLLVRFYPILDFPDTDSLLVTAIPVSTSNAADNQITGLALTAGYLSDWQLQLGTFYRQEPRRIGYQTLFYKDRLLWPNLAGMATLSDAAGFRGGSLGIGLTLHESHQQVRIPANRIDLLYTMQEAYYISEQEQEDLDERENEGGLRIPWKGKVGSLGLKITRDARLTPLKGLHLEGMAEICARELGGDFDFQQYQVDGRYYFHVHHLASLMIRAFWGDTQGEAPLNKRFSLAGPTMLRGYNYNLDYRGSNIAISNVELKWPVHKHFRKDISIKKYFWFESVDVALYYDGGKVWEDWQRTDQATYRHDVGTAMIVKTSIANLIPLDVRIDVAFPLEREPENDQPIVVWFQIGSYF